MPRTLHWIIAAALALAAIAAARAAEPPAYALDPVHTRVLFAVEHAGFSQALGTISGSTGLLRFDPDDWTTARLQAEIPLARLDLGDDKWNRAALARNLLDAEAHPVATFTSTRIEPLADDRARVHGMLDLRGVSRDVVLEVRLNARKRHPLPPFRRTVGFSATATLSRADFGITAWKSVIGDSIELRIEAEATRTRVDGDAGDDGEDPDGDAAAPTPQEQTSMDDPSAEPEPAAVPEATP
ncbi:MAG: YceI family protein [Luteimonas sp.]